MDYLFGDRRTAGRALAAALTGFVEGKTVVLALPRGGVPVGFEIAKAHGLPLGLVLVRKIGAPSQRELALGAVVGPMAAGGEPVILVNDDVVAALGYAAGDVEAMAGRELKEIERQRALYQKAWRPPAIAGRTVVLVDDGIATGASARAAAKALRARGAARLVLAVPVASRDSLVTMKSEFDETVCLSVPERFFSVGGAYEDFRQIEDAEVISLLAAAARRT